MKLTGEEKRKVFVSLIIVSISILVYQILNNLDAIHTAITINYKSIFMPIIVAFFMAYIMNLLMSSIENKFNQQEKLKTLSPGVKRGLSLSLTILLIIIGLVILLAFAIPQFVASINQLVKNIDTYVSEIPKLVDYLTTTFDKQPSPVIVEKVTEMVNSAINFLSSYVTMVLAKMNTWIFGTVSSIFNFILSFSLSIYILIDKEKLLNTFNRLIRSMTSDKRYNQIIRFLTVLNQSFENFFSGQITEGMLLAVISVVSMYLLGFKYYFLIGVIIGLTNIIPIIGSWLGGIVGVFLLLIVDPIQAVWFLLYIIILQQIESNIIYQYVVGGKVGLSGFWMFVAVIVGQGLGGLPGIIIGIPLFTTLQVIVDEYIDKRLAKKGINLASSRQIKTKRRPKFYRKHRNRRRNRIQE
ncbi:Predicted PurR-regulated permease PerM [Granulicatella balaenopterae]|uniref:Predicted PurR-regulated permease PerM n=1 Tax=Granulicatella balaenopterae TaxID=137733 RepID=A0A1H9KYF9_9LACT|nr:AI-2E family transporter [Granulicatella balaenopterae]SER04196.1 Predicted PurR-regulated permease PerM [Granulicatella balaenopterae]